MRSLAIGVAAVLALVTVAPAFAQENGAYAPSSQSNPNQPINPRAQSAYDQAQDAARKSNSKKDKSSKDKSSAAAPDEKSKAKGMAEAPALMQQTGYACTIGEANYVGSSKAKNAEGKEVTTNVYEVTCSEGLGYLILAKEGQTPEAFDCLKLSTNAAKTGGKLTCALPGNADFNKALQPLMAKSGETCTVNKSRWVGTSAESKIDEYEVGCAEGGADILVVPQPGSTKTLAAESCLQASRIGIACEYFTKEQIIAQIKALAAPANRTACQVSDAGYVGQSSTNKHVFYELACSDGKSGFMLETDAAGKYLNAIDCARAGGIAGGCKLTTVSEGDTSDAATYTKLAKEIGYDCAVTSYRSFGMEQNGGREIVELACSNHPAGAVAFMPTSKGQTGDWINCARAEARGLKCGLNKPEATYALINEQLKAKGKDCPVNGARGMGSTAQGEDYVEVTCSSGGGLVLKYAAGKDNLTDVLACAQAKGIGGGCKLQK
jgi:hypothetical protein